MAILDEKVIDNLINDMTLEETENFFQESDKMADFIALTTGCTQEKIPQHLRDCLINKKKAEQK